MIDRFFFKSEFSRNLITLLSGTFLAQLVSFLLSPVISRLYTPTDFGFFALFFSIVSGLSVLICGRYELAIMVPKENEEAINVKAVAYSLCIVLSGFTFLLLLPFVFVFDKLPLSYLLIPFLVFLLGIFQVNNNWEGRKKNYLKISKSRMLNASTNSVATIALGYVKLGALGLILGNFIGQFSANLALQKLSDIWFTLKKVPLSLQITIAKKFFYIPKTNSFQAVVDMLQINGIYYILPLFFSSGVIGLLSFSMRILQAPMSLVGSSLAQIFYQKANEVNNLNENINRMVKQTIIRSSLMGLPIPIVLLFFGPSIFALIFGEEWRESGVFASILSPWIYLDFVRSSISQLAIIINRQKKLLYLSFLGTIVTVSSLFYAGYTGIDIKNGLIILSVGQSILMIWIIVWLFKSSLNYKVEN